MSLLLPALLAGVAAAAPASTYLQGLADESGWKEVASKKHDSVGEIRVRHKKVAGLDCLEGIAHTTASIDKMLSAARDIDGCKAWSSANLLDSAELSKGDTFDYYQVLDNPFPVKDRYWFLRGSTVKVGGATEFQWQHIDPATEHPEAYKKVTEAHPDAVSTGINVGAWVFAPDGDKVRVHYRLCSDPGGAVPDWAGHKAAEMSLPTNIADIIERAQGKR
jgi:hypothetical protein